MSATQKPLQQKNAELNEPKSKPTEKKTIGKTKPNILNKNGNDYTKTHTGVEGNLFYLK